MTKKSTWISSLSRLGIQSNLEDDGSWRTVFSNVVYMCLPVVYIIFMIIDYEAYIQPISKLRFDQTIVPIVIFVCLFCLWLNKKGHTTISKVIFITLWPQLLHVIPIALLQTPPDYYLALPLGIMFHAILTQLMFSYRFERSLFCIFIAANFLLMIFSQKILLFFDTDLDMPVQLAKDKYFLYDLILYWLLFNLVTFYILYVVEVNVKRIRNSKALIESQKEELNTFNQQLEIVVHERTSELEEQNEKLKKHAYYNAHLLRGPFCRIKGLMQLRELGQITDDEKILIKNMLQESISELDTRIKEIQEIVETRE